MWRLTHYQKYRLLETLPGLTVWGTIGGVILFSFLQPLWMVYFAILFDLYWLLRVMYFIIYLTSSWREYHRQKRIDWLRRVFMQSRWERIHHVIFLPTVGEEVEVLRNTFDALKHSTYPAKKMMVVLAGEERMKEHFEKVAATIMEEYGKVFGDLVVTLHPANVPGEIPAKGANIRYAGLQVQKIIDERGWKYENVIVSSFDSDTVVHKQYFAYLTFLYLTHPNPTRTSFQPIALYNNNIWDSPSFARVVAHSTTFWLMAELARPKPLWTFSSHSMSFRALVDVGFWQNDIVTEDSRIYLQCFIHYNGDYDVTPMYIPVSMDTAHAGTLWQTAKNLYKQQRRWAWGIEHFPYMVWHFRKSKKIRGWKKWQLLFNLTEGMYSWSTAPLLILILGYLPLLLTNDVEKATVIAQNAPFVLEWLMRIAMVGIIASAVLNVFLLPTDVPRHRMIKFAVIIAQWVLLPVVLIIFGSIPAIDAQTRMLLGKYLGFYTTKKVRTSRATV